MFADTEQQLEDTTKELEETGKELEETSDNQCVMTTQLRHMTQDRDEHKHLVDVRVITESQLHSQATQQLKTATMSTSDVSGLHAKLDRKHNVESHNASVQEKFRVRFHEGIDDRSTSQQPCYTTAARIVSTLFQLRFDSLVIKGMEEVEQLSAMLSSPTSVIHHDLGDTDEVQQSASQELVSDINQLLEHCSQTEETQLSHAG